MNSSLLPFAGVGIGPGVFGLCGNGQAFCRQLTATGTWFVRHLAHLALRLTKVNAESIRQPAVGRRCLRSDLDQREIVMRLAARKAHLVGSTGRHAAQAVAIPVKRGRRFDFMHE
jgi:hypothetical protein